MTESELKKLQQIAENEQKVFDAGYAKGANGKTEVLKYATAYVSVYEGAVFPDEGYELTLDLPALKNGIDRVISYAKNLTKFTLKGNNDNNATSCQYAFRGGNVLKVIDFSELGSGEEKGRLKPTYLNGAFSANKILESIVGEIDFSVAVNVGGPFGDCTSLKEVRFVENTLSLSMDMKSCRSLSRESIESVVRGFNVSAVGQSLTLLKAAVNKAFETSEGANDGSTSAEWATLIGTRPNWTFNLV